jgi:hypothetical protein
MSLQLEEQGQTILVLLDASMYLVPTNMRAADPCFRNKQCLQEQLWGKEHMLGRIVLSRFQDNLAITQIRFIPRSLEHAILTAEKPSKTSQTPLPSSHRPSFPNSFPTLQSAPHPPAAATRQAPPPPTPLLQEPSRCFSPEGSPAPSPAPHPSSGAGPSRRAPPRSALRRPACHPAASCPLPPLGGSKPPAPLRLLRRPLTPAPRRSWRTR